MRIFAKTLYWLAIALAAIVVAPVAIIILGTLLVFQLCRWIELHAIFDGDEAARDESNARYGIAR